MDKHPNIEVCSQMNKSSNGKSIYSSMCLTRDEAQFGQYRWFNFLRIFNVLIDQFFEFSWLNDDRIRENPFILLSNLISEKIVRNCYCIHNLQCSIGCTWRTVISSFVCKKPFTEYKQCSMLILSVLNCYQFDMCSVQRAVCSVVSCVMCTI